MTPAEALAQALYESGFDGDGLLDAAATALTHLPEGSALVTRETLAKALHDVDDLLIAAHPEEAAPIAEETDDVRREYAAAIIEALRDG